MPYYTKTVVREAKNPTVIGYYTAYDQEPLLTISLYFNISAKCLHYTYSEKNYVIESELLLTCVSAPYIQIDKPLARHQNITKVYNMVIGQH